MAGGSRPGFEFFGAPKRYRRAAAVGRCRHKVDRGRAPGGWPLPLPDKKGGVRNKLTFYIYELTARLCRAVCPTRVSMKAKNPLRLYLVMQLYAAPLALLSSNSDIRIQIQIFGLSDDVRPYRKSTRAAAVGRFRRKSRPGPCSPGLALTPQVIIQGGTK